MTAIYFQGAILGFNTKKVLFISVKNKYCTICAFSERLKTPLKIHSCPKNWDNSSTSMEAAAIVEGFCKSEELYGVRFSKLVADGDSSVYKKILEARPYKTLTVEKIECKNHLLRNVCNRLRDLTTSSVKNKKTGTSTILLRKVIGDRILRIRSAITKAIEFRQSENSLHPQKIEELRKDILNCPSHVFGEHKVCSERGYKFCKAAERPTEKNLVPELEDSGLYGKINVLIRDISAHSRSLIENVTSNPAEHYNAAIAKFIGGKRVNFARGRSYKGRCAAAVIRHNTGMPIYKLHKEMCKSSPGEYCKSIEKKRKRINEFKEIKRKAGKRCKRSLFSKNQRRNNSTDPDYGQFCQKPDIETEEFENQRKEFLENLHKTPEELATLERATVAQRESGEWLEYRRKILTASNFGKICNMRPTTSCQNVVKNLLYSEFDNAALRYGRENEILAKIQLEKEQDIKISECGLFIDAEFPFLGATPDGLIDKDGIVEIKCPSSAAEITPEEAIKSKKITAWKTTADGKILEMKPTHPWYYQIQGQLHITKRIYCLLGLWTPKGMKVENIKRDDSFWDTQMFPKLQTFYLDCLLPELVDPRHPRSMPIRDPEYILEAKNRKTSSNTKK